MGPSEARPAKGTGDGRRAAGAGTDGRAGNDRRTTGDDRGARKRRRTPVPWWSGAILAPPGPAGPASSRPTLTDARDRGTRTGPERVGGGCSSWEGAGKQPRPSREAGRARGLGWRPYFLADFLERGRPGDLARSFSGALPVRSSVFSHFTAAARASFLPPCEKSPK